MRPIILAILFLLCVVPSAFALKAFQLDASPSSYYYANSNADVETVVATSNTFTLRALVDPNKPGYDANDPKYYISAAVWPAITPEPTTKPDLGSFSFGLDTTSGDDGVDINVTGGMTYGTPPIADPALAGNVDLNSHGVFETYFAEFEFDLDDALHVVPYNSQEDRADTRFVETTSDTFMYAVLFDVDVTNLNPDVSIHFDLYQLNYENIIDPDTGAIIDVVPKSIKEFAAWSHDAQSGGGGGKNPVPEPSTLILLGVGLVGLAAYRRKKH